jgi:alpha-beta hydrolase superfamily lysophospholipase
MMNHSRSFLKIENSSSKFFGVLGLGFGSLLVTYASSVLGASCPPLLLASPLFGTKNKLPTWKKMVALSLPRVVPFAQLPRTFITNASSEVENSPLSEDPLNLQTITSRMEEIFLQATNDLRIRNALTQLESSTSILCGTKDSLVDIDRVRDLFPSLGTSHSSLVYFENTGHDLFAKNSPTREQVIETILRWTKSHGAPL